MRTLPYESLMHLSAPSGGPQRTTHDREMARLDFREAEAASYAAAGEMEEQICRAENAYVDHAWTHIEWNGPLFAIHCVTFAVAARHRISSDDYALLTATWRDIFGPLPGEDGYSGEPATWTLQDHQ